MRRRRRWCRSAARVAAPIDMTGTWASVINEDWQWRFVTPIVGDYTGVPLNADGDRLARQWNPDADVEGRPAVQGLRRRRDQPPAHPAADLVGGRQHDEARLRPRHAVAPRLLRQDEGAGRAQPAGPRDRRVDRSAGAGPGRSGRSGAGRRARRRTTGGRRCGSAGGRRRRTGGAGARGGRAGGGPRGRARAD